jgi:hypothetical protein
MCVRVHFVDLDVFSKCKKAPYNTPRGYNFLTFLFFHFLKGWWMHTLEQ